MRLALSVLAVAKRLRYRGDTTEAQVAAALAMLLATDGFLDGFTLLAMNKPRRHGDGTELWICDGAARVLAAARHVAATPECGAGWRDAPVLFLRTDIAPDTMVR